MRRAERLRHRRDFTAVHRKGRPIHGDLLALRLLRNDLDRSRFGFAVGKRLGKAVVRNRIKRRLRAAVVALHPVGGWDVVITARASATTVTYDELVQALASLFRRARLLPDKRDT